MWLSPNEVCIGVAVSVKNICAGFITVSVKKLLHYRAGGLLQYRAVLLHYRAVITLSGVFITLSGTYYSIGRYYIIGWYTCDGEVGRQALPCCSICCCHLIFQLTIWWDTLSGYARSSSYYTVVDPNKSWPGGGGGPDNQKTLDTPLSPVQNYKGPVGNKRLFVMNDCCGCLPVCLRGDPTWIIEQRWGSGVKIFMLMFLLASFCPRLLTARTISLNQLLLCCSQRTTYGSRCPQWWPKYECLRFCMTCSSYLFTLSLLNISSLYCLAVHNNFLILLH